MTSPSIERPIFIVGTGRSGTTLLRNVLSAHSRIAIAPETHFMARAERWGLATCGLRDVESFWDDYTNWVRFTDLGVEARRCRELIDSGDRRDFQKIFAAILSAYGETTGKARIGEKTPGHSRFLPILLEWFPDAQILVMKRDPRAVVASQLHTPYVGERISPSSWQSGIVCRTRRHEVALYAENWSVVYGRRLEPWRGDPRLHTVAYEALVCDPENEMRAVCEFLGEAYEPDMLTRTSRADVPMPAGMPVSRQMDAWRRAHYQKSRSKITRGSLSKWKQELSDLEVAIVEGRCSREMLSMGYEPSVARLKRTYGRLLSRVLLDAGYGEARLRRFDLTPYRRAQAVGPGNADRATNSRGLKLNVDS